MNCSGGDSATEPYVVSDHQLLAHAAVVNLYKQNYQAIQKGVIGITLVAPWFVPLSNATQDKNAAQRQFDFNLGWFLDPITCDEYPHSMQSLVGNRLPKFSKEQSEMVGGSFDFLGLNHYTAFYAAYAPIPNAARPSYMADSHSKISDKRNGIPIGQKGASPWLNVFPKGIHNPLLYVQDKYNDPLIYITENGIDEMNNSTASLIESLTDNMRIGYSHAHLSFLRRALQDGVKVNGYFAWSLLDNFEWSYGYTKRFGINFVDYKDGLKRYPKRSANWFKNFLQKY